jgi:hypothetical protein
MLSFRPVQTGDSCYLQDHHNRPGECLITVSATDHIGVGEAVDSICEAVRMEDRIPHPADMYADDMQSAGVWVVDSYRAATADAPPASEDDEPFYLDCHILVTWQTTESEG